MRVLLDECLPRPLKSHLSQHDVTTVPEMGWAGVKDPVLLRLAGPMFHALITIDRGLPAALGEASAGLIIVLLRARSNRLRDLEQLIPEVSERLLSARAGEIIRVPGPLNTPANV